MLPVIFQFVTLNTSTSIWAFRIKALLAAWTRFLTFVNVITRFVVTRQGEPFVTWTNSSWRGKRRSTCFKLPRKLVKAVKSKVKACSRHGIGPHQKMKALIFWVSDFSSKHNVGQYICTIDQGWVKMAGECPSLLLCLFFFFSAQYPAILTEQAWSINDSL